VSQTGTLPDVQTAYDTLFQGIHARVFFQKCAAAGFSPRTQEEAQHMLNTAGKLRQISEMDHVKQAAAQDNPYFQMEAGLDNLMNQYGLNQPQTQYASDEMYKAAADSLMQDPTFYNSVLALKAAEAEQLKAEYDAWQAQNGG
jgi:hypothetical protein